MSVGASDLEVGGQNASAHSQKFLGQRADVGRNRSRSVVIPDICYVGQSSPSLRIREW